ncbi:MAG: hypothetical protein JWP42_2230 [Pseudomonas sp.]|nr:hypothetical protein [Pseudomonas sp.]
MFAYFALGSKRGYCEQLLSSLTVGVLGNGRVPG